MLCTFNYLSINTYFIEVCSEILFWWVFISFCLFFVFNLYARRLSYREDFASSSALFEREVPWEFPVAMQWAIFFCRLLFLFTESIFYFAAGISLLPWPIYCFREHFSFAAIIFLLPRKFLFCRRSFSFARSFFLLPWPISFLPRTFFFCRELFSFAVTLVGHRRTQMKIKQLKQDILNS